MSVKASFQSYSRHCVKSGWLKKQGGVVKSWKERFFIIKGGYMTYYAKEDDSKKLGSIELIGNRVVEVPSSNNGDDPPRFLFEIISGEGQGKMASNHETYLLWAETDQERKDWMKAIRRVMYASIGGAIFGQNLRDTMLYESRQGQRKVPQIVEQCTDFIIKHGLEVEGVFRLPGRAAFIKEIRERYDLGQRPDLEQLGADIHTVCSLLKLYLRELPEPLIPYEMYEKFYKVAMRDICEDEDKAFDKLIEYLSKVPVYDYNVLKHMCKFLHTITEHCEVNKMHAVNLGTIFNISFIAPNDDDPTLLMGVSPGLTQISALLIANQERLFKLEYNSNGDSIVVDNLLDMENQETSEQSLVPPLTPATVELMTGLTLSSEEAREMMKNGSGELSDSLSTDSDSSSAKDFAELDPISYISRLEQEISKLKSELKSTKKEKKALKEKYEKQIVQMAKKMSDEKESTAASVARIIDLQSKLQEYQLKYGPLG
ncbi:unnamed protein product [Owenia fusiformis]|uniref:Uncharacterized protein n=1 Tax=Owenia fusiformis TaxID=6347 RepID=A0A8J1XZG3_OWEFU|nr:unnamed protein product [Owenia fusiformis]